MDHLHGDKSSLERKLYDAEIELKSIDDSHRQSQPSLTRQSSTNRTEDENSTNLDDNKPIFHIYDDDDDGLSDSDSDVIEMKQTLTQLKHISTLPTSLNEQKIRKTTELSKTNNINPFRRTISYERPSSNQSLIDSGQWSHTVLSTINNTYPLSHYQSSGSQTNFWQSQPSLITREAVLKAARDVLPPGVIDHLKSTH